MSSQARFMARRPAPPVSTSVPSMSNRTSLRMVKRAECDGATGDVLDVRRAECDVPPTCVRDLFLPNPPAGAPWPAADARLGFARDPLVGVAMNDDRGAICVE